VCSVKGSRQWLITILFLRVRFRAWQINNAEARQGVFDRARTVLAEELGRQNPQKSALEILRERSALETAIRRVEAEWPPTHPQTPKGPPPRAKDTRPLDDRLKANEVKARTAPEPAQPEEIGGSVKRSAERKLTNPESIASKGTSAGTAASTDQGERQPATIRYLNCADLKDIFADSISGLIFDGETLRVEFVVSRLRKETADSPISARQYPVCRLVLPPTAAIDFANRMQQIAPVLTQAMKAAQQQSVTDVTKAG
jgi:hypothetical protein